MNERVLVEINLEIQPDYEKTFYDGYRVRIIDSQSGELSNHHFSFSDYLNEQYEQTKYALRDYSFRYNRLRWWGDQIPKDALIKEMANTIFEYISHFNK